MTFLKQGFYIQQWQYGGGVAAEKDIHALIALAVEYNAAGIMEKCADGLSWMGRITNSSGQLITPKSPTNIADVLAHRDATVAAGLDYLPWVNPLHGNRAFLRVQATLYALIGQRVGRLAWDTEPYEHFWGANRPVGDAAFLMDEFRRHAPDCVNVWQPDPRDARLAELRPLEWAQHMNVYAPQAYFGDFQTAPAAEIEHAWEQRNALGIAEVAPTISTGGATPEGFAEAITAMGELGMTSLCAWRLGTLDAPFLNVLHDLAGHQEPEPVHDCNALRAELLELKADAPTVLTAKQIDALLAL